MWVSRALYTLMPDAASVPALSLPSAIGAVQDGTGQLPHFLALCLVTGSSTASRAPVRTLKPWSRAEPSPSTQQLAERCPDPQDDRTAQARSTFPSCIAASAFAVMLSVPFSDVAGVIFLGSCSSHKLPKLAQVSICAAVGHLTD